MVHQDLLERQLEALQDRLIMKLSMIFYPPPTDSLSASTWTSEQSQSSHHPASRPLSASGEDQGPPFCQWASWYQWRGTGANASPHQLTARYQQDQLFST